MVACLSRWRQDPKRVAQNSDAVAAALVLGGFEGAADLNRNSENREQVCGTGAGRDSERRTFPRDIHIDTGACGITAGS